MFNFNQTNQIKTAAASNGLELWKIINCENPEYNGFLEIQMQDGLNACSDHGRTDYWGEEGNLPALTLDNLLPWFDENFGEIENPEWGVSYNECFRKAIRAKEVNTPPFVNAYMMAQALLDLMPKTLAKHLKIKAMELYYTEPQKLADMICEAIINLKK
jgi:hypothetical protein